MELITIFIPTQNPRQNQEGPSLHKLPLNPRSFFGVGLSQARGRPTSAISAAKFWPLPIMPRITKAWERMWCEDLRNAYGGGFKVEDFGFSLGLQNLHYTK